MPAPSLILGCGYVGAALAKFWMARGQPVVGWVRHEGSAASLRREGLPAVAGDLADAAAWDSPALPAAVATLVHCASSSGGVAADYRRVYLEGLRHALDRVKFDRAIFVSSTSVYGQTDGSWVDESSPADPASETGRVLRGAEKLAVARGAVVARVAGIYGPGRCVHLAKVREGTARLDGDGSRWINQAHRDDVVSALARLAGLSDPRSVYNVVDNTPVPQRDLYAWLSQQLARPMPEPASAASAPPRKRGVTNKRVSNALLRSAGWEPAFPSYREGYAGELKINGEWKMENGE